MTQQIELTSDMSVELVDSMGSDMSVVNAARVSFNQNGTKLANGNVVDANGYDLEKMSERNAGLINFLMKNKHASPFEHCTASFLVTAPIIVVREWQRHRTQSYNEVSGRYTELQPKFYAPDLTRPLIQSGKPGAYKFDLPEDDVLYYETWREMRFSYQTNWDAYQTLLGKGVAKEVARGVLPLNIYTGWYATANLRNWVNFLALRAEEQAMWEIRQLAFQVEEKLHKLFPVTMETWVKNGRGSI